jgi:hypothetical protein
LTAFPVKQPVTRNFVGQTGVSRTLPKGSPLIVKLALSFLLLRSAGALVSLLVGSMLIAAAPLPPAPTYSGPTKAGVLEAPPRQETSGLAASRRAADILWTHDDSRGAAVLYAVDTTGKKRGALRVVGVKNEDWEDVASFTKDGKAWLVVGDVGDNDAERKTVQVHVLEEPAPEQLKPETQLEVRPAYTLRIRYEDGPRDCESIAVDPVEGAIYLLSKRDNPPRLYRAPLRNSRDNVIEAQLVEPVSDIIGTTPMDALIKRMVGKKYSWPTGMDFSADGQSAVVLTYGEALVFHRQRNEPWSAAFKRPPTRLPFHGLPQAEAVCFSADSQSIFVASESAENLVRYDRSIP